MSATGGFTEKDLPHLVTGHQAFPSGAYATRLTLMVRRRNRDIPRCFSAPIPRLQDVAQVHQLVVREQGGRESVEAAVGGAQSERGFA